MPFATLFPGSRGVRVQPCTKTPWPAPSLGLGVRDLGTSFPGGPGGLCPSLSCCRASPLLTPQDSSMVSPAFGVLQEGTEAPGELQPNRSCPESPASFLAPGTGNTGGKRPDLPWGLGEHGGVFSAGSGVLQSYTSAPKGAGPRSGPGREAQGSFLPLLTRRFPPQAPASATVWGSRAAFH